MFGVVLETTLTSAFASGPSPSEMKVAPSTLLEELFGFYIRSAFLCGWRAWWAPRLNQKQRGWPLFLSAVLLAIPVVLFALVRLAVLP